jgi:hypothetical protein
MSEQGYLSKKRTAQLAKLMDGAIDFNKLFPNRKILGVFSVGHFLERKDRKLFETLIDVLDNKLIGKNPNAEVVEIIEKVLTLLENKDFGELSVFTSGLLSERIQTPFEAFEKQIFTSVILMFNGMLGKVVDKAYELTEKADNE